jgi:hypothetical protein
VGCAVVLGPIPRIPLAGFVEECKKVGIKKDNHQSKNLN